MLLEFQFVWMQLWGHEFLQNFNHRCILGAKLNIQIFVVKKKKRFNKKKNLDLVFIFLFYLTSLQNMGYELAFYVKEILK